MVCRHPAKFGPNRDFFKFGPNIVRLFLLKSKERAEVRKAGGEDRMEDVKKSGGSMKALVVVLIVLVALLIGVAVCDKVYLPPKFYGEMTEELKDSGFYRDIAGGGTVCFVGDSITVGTQTRDLGWYEPLVPYIKGKVVRFAHSGWTTTDLLEHEDEIPAADIYVVAIGINDVTRPQDGAATAEEYVENLKALSEGLDGKIYYVAPWIVVDGTENEVKRRDEYAAGLSSWAGEAAIDPYPSISRVLEEEGAQKYMRDRLHPNLRRGLGLYCYAVLTFSSDRD